MAVTVLEKTPEIGTRSTLTYASSVRPPENDSEEPTPAAHPSSTPLLAFARPAVLAVSVLLLCRDIAAPFNAWHELNDAAHAQFARNHIQYGLGYTAFYSTGGDTLTPPPTPQRYLNHPPLVALWTAVPLLLFGDHEWSARLVPISATVGSTALLMTIVGRLGSPLLSALAGLFFATLPLTTFFGRMIDHEAPVQFFSLLMIHGYLEWAGIYGESGRRRRGALNYGLGAALGIGTGWPAILAAGLLWSWHALRAARGTAEARKLLWLAAPPALALGAVMLHIAAGCGWDFGVFRALLEKRSFGGEGGQQAWSAWLAMQWLYFVRNFTWPGAVGSLLSLPLLLAALVRDGRGDRGPRFPLTGNLAAVTALCGLQGFLWVVLLKNQSWFHDYWQFFLGPYIAVSSAGLVVAVRESVTPFAPRLAQSVVTLLVVSPMPFAAASRDFYSEPRLVDPEYIQALVTLGGLVPPRAPVWTSHRLRLSAESFGRYTYSWADPIVAYYANRPLFFSRDPREVQENAPRCVAYLLKQNEAPWAREIELTLSRSFEAVPVGDHHLIFLLNRPAPRVPERQ